MALIHLTRTNFLAFVFLIVGALAHVQAQAKIQVVTTTTDMKALVEAIGGESVTVTSIAKGTQDAHRIEAKPSFMVTLSKADLVVLQGLNLETAWIDPLLRGSRNPNIQKGTKGFLELGSSISPIETHAGPVTRADGDVHPEGNPHFQLDPVRMIEAAKLVAAKLTELDPKNKKQFEERSNAYAEDMNKKLEDWKKRLKNLKLTEAITYHKTFSYFCDRFQIQCKIQLEPKPGIPPTTSHIIDVLQQMRERNIKFVLIENYFDGAIRSKIKSEIPDAKIILAPVSVGGDTATSTTQDLIEKLVTLLERP